MRKNLIQYKRELGASVLLAVALLLVFFLYKPGLSGGFIFDDFLTLEEIGQYGGVVDWESFKVFVFNGFTGPSGRPISLASFLINDNHWPASPYGFKLTNLLIHMLNGVLLAWATLNLLRNLRVDEFKAQQVAVLSASLWMLHPLMVSTTLYVVQRMAELSAMFMFAGMAGYWWGRREIEYRPMKGALICLCSVGVGTVLATLSKENGALLPALLLIGELYLPKIQSRRYRFIVFLALAVPSAAILIYLFSKLSITQDLIWKNRLFTQHERVLTEARILFYYLWQFFVPRIEGMGLFQDGYQISRTIINPISTLMAVIGVLSLLIGSVFVRSKQPLLGFAALFYFTAHIMESGWLNLELYFEHRNYVATCFLMLPFSYFILKYFDGRFKLTAIIVVSVIVVLLSFFTFCRAKLWGDSTKLQLFWAVSTPDSARAHNYIASYYFNNGDYDWAIKELQSAQKALPQSSLLTINLLLMKVYANEASELDFDVAAEQMKRQPMDAQAAKGLRSLVEKISAQENKSEYGVYALKLLDEINKNKNYGEEPTFRRLYWYLKANLFLHLENYDFAKNAFIQAMKWYGDTDSALSMVADMANRDRPVEALELLQNARLVFDAQSEQQLRKSKESYQKEFDRMKFIFELRAKELESMSKGEPK